MTPANPDALADALAYLKPHETNGGTISLKASKAREAVAVIEEALQRVTAERDLSHRTNDLLRAGLANSGGPCLYCTLPREEWTKCEHGFPGCGRSDDAMLCPHFGAEMEGKDRADAAEARTAQLQAEVEAKDRALKDERARRKAATQSLREKAAALCDEAAAYFDRTTGHYDRTQAAGGYRATASKIRLLTPDRTALARATTAREGQAD